MFPNPELFGITFHWYTLFHRAALIIASLFFITWCHYKKPFRLSLGKTFLLITFLVIIGYSGARLFAGLAFFAQGGSWEELLVLLEKAQGGGYRWYGTLIALVLCFPMFVKVFTLERFARIFDLLGMTFCLFTVIVKQACLFSGDGCYGTITALPWGMYFPYGTAPNILPVHPTPLYDSVLHLFAFLFLIRFNGRARFYGQTGLLYLLITSVLGYCLETIRINPEVALGLGFAQFCYLTLLGIALMLYLKAQKIKMLRIFKHAQNPIIIK